MKTLFYTSKRGKEVSRKLKSAKAIAGKSFITVDNMDKTRMLRNNGTVDNGKGRNMGINWRIVHTPDEVIKLKVDEAA